MKGGAAMPKKLSKDVRELLMTAARRAANNAYAPYSCVRVGAAVLTGSDRVFVGCNVENASHGLTTCAERVAIQNAVAAGEKGMTAVAVFSPDIKCITPCGACRQVMAEFSPDAGLSVLLEGKKGTEAIPLGKLLPRAFKGSRNCKGRFVAPTTTKPL
jgi:cytidine deaminase